MTLLASAVARPPAGSPFPEGGILSPALSFTPQSQIATSLERAAACARIASDNKGRDIVVLDMRGLTPLYDFFVLVNGTSRRQVHTITEEIDDEMHRLGD